MLLNLLVAVPGLCQKVTLSGYLRDAESGESLPVATVYVKEAATGAQTNNYGFYSVSVPPGTYTVIYSYVGYQTQVVSLTLTESQTRDAELPGATALNEVVVTDARKDEAVRGTEMGTVTLDPGKMKTLPILMGEADILKTLQLLPGVQSAGEGNAGFYVRGGGPDQNLILLDDAVVYNTGHLFGFFSVFNSDALKSTTLIKGGMPAQYGGRLSSVVDVQMKEGNLKKFAGEGGIGLIASRLLLEGPLKKDKGSFMVSGRRTYIDALIRPFAKNTAFNGSGYYFYDVNLKGNWRFSKHDRVYLSGYFGRDNFTFNNGNQSFKAKIPWGNSTATLRWNHLFSDRLFLNTTAVYNDYKFSFSGTQNNFDIKLASGIRDLNLKTDADYYAPFNHHFKAGLAYTYHTFIPNQVSGRSDSISFDPSNAFTKYAHEAAAYVQDDWEPTPWLRVAAGLRYSLFSQIGPYTQYQYGFNRRITDSVQYGSGEPVQTYGGFEPRLNLRFQLSKTASIKTSVSRTFQYIHLVANNGSTLPTDIWVPSTAVVKPQESWQYSAGFFKNFLSNALETSVEVYYKPMRNQIEYRQGYIPTTIEDVERSFVFGSGEAYGAEFFVNKTRGAFTGWIGYTLAWTWRDFPALNNGMRYPAKYDRRHDLSLVLSYERNKRWTFGAVFVYGSGNAITLPTNFYFISGQLVQEYSAINAYRIFPYHRLDLSATYKPQPKRQRRVQSSWTFSVYNAYNRMNPYFLYIDTRGNTSQGIEATVKQVSIFPVLPSVTYNFKF